MPTRTYHQHCSLARALDLVGERWTLLLVRDLLPGPRRYGELLEGLPGMGTNLLAARLKELTALGLLERVAAPGERGSAYALTPTGRELEPALVALARFGLRHLGVPREDDLWRPQWSPLALRARFDPQAARGLTESYAFVVEDTPFHARLDDGNLTAAPGPVDSPAFRLTASAERFLEFAGGSLDLDSLPQDVGFEGDPKALARCARVFGGTPDGA